MAAVVCVNGPVSASDPLIDREFVFAVRVMGFLLRGLGREKQHFQDLFRLPGAEGSYSQRKTFAESTVKKRNNTVIAETSPMWVIHPSPFQIPLSRFTA